MMQKTEEKARRKRWMEGIRSEIKKQENESEISWKKINKIKEEDFKETK